MRPMLEILIENGKNIRIHSFQRETEKVEQDEWWKAQHKTEREDGGGGDKDQVKVE